MVEPPATREPTGKQIKEAAKAAKKALVARKKKPYSIHTDPRLRHLSVKEKNEIKDKQRRTVHERTMKKIPRRPYNGTGATGQNSSQHSSQGTTNVLQTTAPPVRSQSSGSSSPSGNSSNDMEAGYMDVVEEESRAALAAKKEDEEEARLEARLKMAKERRRMREGQTTSRQR